MKQLSKQKPDTGSKERGAYLAMMSFGIVVVLALAGLALNAAKLYLDKLNLQKAADAAVVAGLGYYVRHAQEKSGDFNSSFQINLRNQADAAALYNLQNSYPELNLNAHNLGNFFSLTPTYSQGNGFATSFQYEISTTNQFKDLFLRVVHLIGGRVTVKAVAKGELKRAHVALMLDTSGSMSCPRAAGSFTAGGVAAINPGDVVAHNFTNDDVENCTCLRQGGCPDAVSKLKVLKTAAQNFLNAFTNGYDHISIIPFNTGAYLAQSMAPPLNLTSAQTLVSNLTATGNTNTSDALMHAYLVAKENGFWGNQEISYVYFSDGAPTAGRFLFANPKNLPKNRLQLQNWSKEGDYDYLHYRVEWDPPPSQGKYAPSALMQTGKLSQSLFDWSQGFPPGWNNPPTLGAPPLDPNGNPPPGIPLCTEQRYDNFKWNALTNCLNDFSFHLPAKNPNQTDNNGFLTHRLGSNVPMNSSRFSEQYYNVSLALADRMRTTGAHASRRPGVFYVIGLGYAPANDRNSGPYQNVEKDFTRHDYFLARLALDPYAAEANPGGSGTSAFRYVHDAGGGAYSNPPYQFRQSDNTVSFYVTPPSPDFSNDTIGQSTGIAPWTNFFPPSSCTHQSCRLIRYAYGEYLPTNNPDELNELFARIARKILLKLIQ